MLAKEEDIFKLEELAAQLKEDGVIKIPFLNADELNKLNEFYNQLHPDGNPPAMYDGIHMTIWHSDLNYKLKIRDEIKEILKPSFERNFQDYRAISQQFIVKQKGEKTIFPIHQDWSIVDEEKYFSLNIWIPLQDVDESNGAMWIVKGSHKIGNKVRGAGVLFPDFYSSIEKLKPYTTSFPMKAGEALIFYHSTIHGSPHNQSENPRITIQVTLLPQEAPMHIYFQKDDNSPLEIHNPVDDFNFYYNQIREDSQTIPPTNSPTEIRASEIPFKFSIEKIIESVFL